MKKIIIYKSKYGTTERYAKGKMSLSYYYLKRRNDNQKSIIHGINDHRLQLEMVYVDGGTFAMGCQASSWLDDNIPLFPPESKFFTAINGGMRENRGDFSDCGRSVTGAVFGRGRLKRSVGLPRVVWRRLEAIF